MDNPICKCGQVMDRCNLFCQGKEYDFWMCPVCHRSMTDEERQSWVKKELYREAS